MRKNLHLPLYITPLKKEMANKIFIMPGNSLCQDKYISDIKAQEVEERDETRKGVVVIYIYMN